MTPLRERLLQRAYLCFHRQVYPFPKFGLFVVGSLVVERCELVFELPRECPPWKIHLLVELLRETAPNDLPYFRQLDKSTGFWVTGADGRVISGLVTTVVRRVDMRL
ncbi:hypothetical protein LIER_03937 [Lithospermum erythrorhizon]|uniref:Uncharacterized protein n=1 Tax=Lithospermum erythrorhizon TaxID=34254 RepID=A0AAV3NZ11_LITER